MTADLASADIDLIELGRRFDELEPRLTTTAEISDARILAAQRKARAAWEARGRKGELHIWFIPYEEAEGVYAPEADIDARMRELGEIQSLARKLQARNLEELRIKVRLVEWWHRPKFGGEEAPELDDLLVDPAPHVQRAALMGARHRPSGGGRFARRKCARYWSMASKR